MGLERQRTLTRDPPIQPMAGERDSTGAGDLPQIPALDDGGVWLTPGVKGIGTASLLADAGHEIPTAQLPSLLPMLLRGGRSAVGGLDG